MPCLKAAFTLRICEVIMSLIATVLSQNYQTGCHAMAISIMGFICNTQHA
jgi:hypothetical protein